MKSTTRWAADSRKRSISNASNANSIIAAYHSTPKRSCKYAIKAFPSRKHIYQTFLLWQDHRRNQGGISTDRGTSRPVIELLKVDKVQDGSSRKLCIIPQGNCRAMGLVIPFVKIRVRRNIPRAKRAAPAVARGCRIRDLAGGESPKGWLWRSPSREGRWGKWVSCEWRSGGVGKRPSSGDGARHRQSRLRDSPPGQGSWSRVSANLLAHMEPYMWDRGDADTTRFRA